MPSEDQLHRQLLPEPIGHRLLGWLGPLLAAALGGVLRFWNLGSPHQLVFDETYYVKQGWSLIQFGVEMRNNPVFGQQIDPMFTQGTPHVFGTEGDFVVHPPVGKWIIGWGESLFGITDSFGWRFSVAVLGTLSILLIGRVARRMFGSSLLGTVAALLLAFEGHHFVHSRTGLLDLIVMFFAFAAFAALLLDRDHARARLARRVAAAGPGGLDRTGPGLGLRPWRLVAGVLLGLAAGTKWSGAYFLVVFGLMTVAWDIGARRAVGVRGWRWAWLVRDAPAGFVTIVPAAISSYVASWAGWFATDRGYDRSWALEYPAEAGQEWIPGALRSWWHYQAQILDFHRSLSATHPYQTNPWSWLVQGRPTSFFYEGPKIGEDGCTVEQCSKAITSIGTPIIWWAATAMMLVLVFRWALRRDWRAGAILAGYAGGYLPWFFIGERTIYSFYAVAFVPWVVLSVTYGMGLLIGGPQASRERRSLGMLLTGVFLVATVLLFAFFYPIYTAQVVPFSFWQMHMWFPSWV